MDFLKTLKSPSPVFPNDRNIIAFINEEDSISSAFQTLIKNQVLSAPVFSNREKKYCYMLSMRDILDHALHILDECEFAGDDTPAVAFLTEKEHFRKYRVKDIAGNRDKLVQIGTDFTVDKVVELMVDNNAHRIIVLNPDNSLSNLITQSRVVECLVQLFDISPSLGALGKRTVENLGLAKTDNLISCQNSDKTIDAFRKMNENQISGIPVLNSEKMLVGNISESDLKAIESNARFLKLLHLPVCEYLEALGQRNVVKCKPSDTFRQVVERVTESYVHRCYVVDDDDHLIGVISLHNILEALVKYSSPAP